MPRFTKKSVLPANVQTCFTWHERPGALERCIPPWEKVTVVRRSGSIQPGGVVELIIRPLGFPIKWVSHHVEYEKNVFFTDLQHRGPFKSFVHTHRFYQEENGASSTLVDDIRYELPGGRIGRLLHGSIAKQLEQSFRYRHHMLAHDLAAHATRPLAPLTILISGASGLVGQSLVPFLTTGGHRVIRLVRRKPSDADEVQWNPDRGELDIAGIGPIDAVINLSGENIGEGRWSKAKKERILSSRINTTRLLVTTMKQMTVPPQVFLSSSAIGYYGDQGDTPLSETSKRGSNFISSVCDTWEQETLKARNFMRVVTLRIGVVLTPKGGALARLLTPARYGLGGPLGSGKQIMSWISISDLIYSFHHCLFQPDIHGPVNLTSPNPVSNRIFAKTLGQKLKRPAKLPVPAALIKLAFGQMGREIPLASTRALPQKLIDTGFRFTQPTLGVALNYLIGTIPGEYNES